MCTPHCPTYWSEQQHEYQSPQHQTSVPVVHRDIVQGVSEEEKYDHLCNITGGAEEEEREYWREGVVRRERERADEKEGKE